MYITENLICRQGLYVCVIFDKNSFIDAACTWYEIMLQVLY